MASSVKKDDLVTAVRAMDPRERAELMALAEYGPPPERPRDKRALVVEILRRKAGNISEACRAAGIGRNTFYRWKERLPKFAEAVEEANEIVYDFTVSKLMQAIAAGQAWAICFYLKCQWKHRGWQERQEITGPDGGPLAATLTHSAVDLSRLTREDLEQLRDIIARAADTAD